MTRKLELHPDRLLPADPTTRGIARTLYAEVADLPIISPHGHTDPRWFATDEPWADASDLLLAPDHYVFRMLYSQGIALNDLGIPHRGGRPATDPRAAWKLFASNYHLFRGTPSRMWLDHVFAEVFGFDEALEAATADRYFDAIGEALATPPSAPARCSSGSASNAWRRPRAPTIRWSITRRSRPRAGRAASSPPIAPTA
ncbi:hypothetical protein GCM10020258_11780 [Sphingomonas yabuuchiae]